MLSLVWTEVCPIQTVPVEQQLLGATCRADLSFPLTLVPGLATGHGAMNAPESQMASLRLYPKNNMGPTGLTGG